MFHKYIFLLGQRWRNPSLAKIYNSLKQSEKYSLEDLQKMQLERLKDLVSFAYKNSSYYKRVFDIAKVHPDDIQNLTDISKLPLLTKQDLLRYNQEIHTTKIVKYSKLFKANTSGTTGQSLQFVRDEYADSYNRASIFRGYSWYNVHPWDFNGYFWGFNFSGLQKIKTRLLDFLVNRFRLFSYTEKYFLHFIRRIKKAVYLEGYSSMIYQTAKLINERKYPKPKNLKMVKGTSEKIYESYQEEVQKAFGLKMISEYGAAETGIIAFECPYGNMHLNMEGVVVEEIEHEIVVTNLSMKSFPVIRYKLGDYIELEKSEIFCPCGMKHPVLKEINGRIGEVIYGKREIYPSLYFYYIFKNLDKNHHLALTYQIIQPQKGQLEFLIAERLNELKLEILKVEIERYFSGDMEYEIFDKQEVIINKKGKLKSFITHVEN